MDFMTWTRRLMKKSVWSMEQEHTIQGDTLQEHTVEEPCPVSVKRECPRFFLEAPLEYSTSDGSPIRGAYTGNISEGGLLIYSIDQLQVGTELRLMVFYASGYQLDGFRAVAKVVWKEVHYEKEWKGFRYGVQFLYMSETDRRKLREILKGALIEQNNLWKQGIELSPQTMEARS